MHRLTEFSLRRPWLTLTLLLAITVGLGAGALRVKQAFGFRVLVGEDHPAIQALDSLVEEFAGGYPARIGWVCGPGHPCQHAFDETSLRLADELVHQLESAPAVANAIGPANASLFRASPEGFVVRRLVEDGRVAPDVEELGAQALSEPLWVGDLVSEDGRVGVVIVQAADNRPETDILFTAALDDAVAPFRAQGFDLYILGDAPGTVKSGRALADSTAALTPVLVGIVGILLYALTRSWQHSLVTLITMGLGLLWTRGVLGWLGWPQDGILQVLAPLVVIVGVCDAMHLLNRYSAERQENPKLSVRAALMRAAADAGPACVITSLTSAAAFASFVSSNLDTFVRFGVILPFGVFACLILTFSLLPLLLERLPAASAPERRAHAAWRPAIDWVLHGSRTHHATLLSASLALLVFFGVGWAVHLRADNNWLESVGDADESVQANAFFEENIGNSQSLELDIRMPPGTAIEDPATLDRIEALTASLSEIEVFTETASVLDLIEKMNRLLHADSPAFERRGDSAAANAQLLELLTFDDPETLGRWLSLDRSRLRISLTALENTLQEKEATVAVVQQRIRQLLPHDWQVQLTGQFAIEHDWVRDVQATQFVSFPIAFGIVFLLVGIFLGSWNLALAAMVPTLLPVVVLLGAMGWLGMTLDVARAMIAAVVIGIGVDDAVHVLAHYKRRRDQGDDPRQAITAALHHTGRAVVTTSVALALGFLTLMMSAWQTVASFGFFVALAIMGALVATLLVLPALIFAFAERQTATLTARPALSHATGQED